MNSTQPPLRRDPLAATPAKMLPYIEALARETRQIIARELGSPVTSRSLLAAADTFLTHYERTWEAIQKMQFVAHACQSGCNHCCYLTVEATAPEVFLLAAYLRQTRTQEQITALQERLCTVARQVQGLTPSERIRADIPCALLEDGMCSAYPARPLGCRSWNSRDVAACARLRAEGEGDLRSVQDQRPPGINTGVHAGFVEALRAAGLSEDMERPYELNTALRIALEVPQALERWLAGEEVLQEARQAVRYAEAPHEKGGNANSLIKLRRRIR